MSLTKNQIGNRGVKVLADALFKNNVTPFHAFMNPFLLAFDTSIQTLETVCLAQNAIGDEGIEQFGRLIASNTVTHIFALTPLLHNSNFRIDTRST